MFFLRQTFYTVWLLGVKNRFPPSYWLPSAFQSAWSYLCLSRRFLQRKLAVISFQEREWYTLSATSYFFYNTGSMSQGPPQGPFITRLPASKPELLKVRNHCDEIHLYPPGNDQYLIFEMCLFVKVWICSGSKSDRIDKCCAKPLYTRRCMACTLPLFECSPFHFWHVSRTAKFDRPLKMLARAQMLPRAAGSFGILGHILVKCKPMGTKVCMMLAAPVGQEQAGSNYDPANLVHGMAKAECLWITCECLRPRCNYAGSPVTRYSMGKTVSSTKH